jgi:hypothetical protein
MQDRHRAVGLFVKRRSPGPPCLKRATASDVAMPISLAERSRNHLRMPAKLGTNAAQGGDMHVCRRRACQSKDPEHRAGWLDICYSWCLSFFFFFLICLSVRGFIRASGGGRAEDKKSLFLPRREAIVVTPKEGYLFDFRRINIYFLFC